MPSLCKESPTHLAVMAAAISGTMYCRPPVNSNMITTNDTTNTHHITSKNQINDSQIKWLNVTVPDMAIMMLWNHLLYALLQLLCK